MSLTLRDAQHLSWKTYKKLQTLNPNGSTSLETPAELTKKAEEIAQKIAAAKTSSADGQKLGSLLSEMLFAAFVLAEQHGVSLEESFLQTVDELILRMVS